jgi:3-oxoacyl-[acyl-carrier protein] reductase
LVNETILVTGGSRGIGRAVVESLVRDGAHVAFTYRSQESEARQIEADSRGHARAFQLDLGDPERPGLLVTEVEALLGPIVGLVNNAGIRKDALLALMSDDDWNAVLDTNLGGVFRCCRAVMRGMVLRRRGSIVNMASISAFHGLSGQAAYAASKAGVLGLTRSLAREIGKRKIRVNAVVPGFVPTDLTADLKPAQIEALRATECLPGGVTLESVAETVIFLLSERSSSITGQALVVDAGSTA